MALVVYLNNKNKLSINNIYNLLYMEIDVLHSSIYSMIKSLDSEGITVEQKDAIMKNTLKRFVRIILDHKLS
jgi:hypothetical protein